MYATSVGKMASNLTSFTSRSTADMDYKTNCLGELCQIQLVSPFLLFPCNFSTRNWLKLNMNAKSIGIHINYNKAKGSNELASTSLSFYFLEMNSYFVGVVAIRAMKS